MKGSQAPAYAVEIASRPSRAARRSGNERGRQKTLSPQLRIKPSGHTSFTPVNGCYRHTSRNGDDVPPADGASGDGLPAAAPRTRLCRQWRPNDRSDERRLTVRSEESTVGTSRAVGPSVAGESSHKRQPQAPGWRICLGARGPDLLSWITKEADRAPLCKRYLSTNAPRDVTWRKHNGDPHRAELRGPYGARRTVKCRYCPRVPTPVPSPPELSTGRPQLGRGDAATRAQ